ncbi:MAG: hypothetical protein U0794_10655 [Isosphaeraceae bacterium]
MSDRRARVRAFLTLMMVSLGGIAGFDGTPRAVAQIQPLAPGDDLPPPVPLPQAEAQPQGAEVLTQGPIHEAFAEPVVFDPRPGPVVAKAPPPLVEEAPPDQKPEGTHVVWLPGYWAWDDGRNDFIWVSGLWRDVPPGRQWVPGYWVDAPGGYRWVAGAWVTAAPARDAQVQTIEYLPEPPASLEAGPSAPSPVAGAVWVPGVWLWQPNRYVWRPGFWTAYQPDWVWIPAHYVWTPGGYLFVDGYWDRTFARRGIAFAPVYFAQPVYQQPRFVYTPTISLVTTALVASLFVRPACHQYYFGDYYATTYVRSGIYPAYTFHQSRYGYDPVFAHVAAVNLRRDPRWLDRVHDEYRYRREHPEARPPQTYAQLREVVNRSVTVNQVTNVNQTTVNITRNLVLARPLSQIAANPRLASAPGFMGRPGANAAGAGSPNRLDPAVVATEAQNIRFTRVDEARRREAAQQAAELRQFRQQRLREELAAARAVDPSPARPRPDALPKGAPARRNELPKQPVARPETSPTFQAPRRLNLARSPIAAPAGIDGPPGSTPRMPAQPTMPAVDPGARPRPGNAAAIRPEPGAERPRHFPGSPGAPDSRPKAESPRPGRNVPRERPPQPPGSAPDTKRERNELKRGDRAAAPPSNPSASPAQPKPGEPRNPPRKGEGKKKDS